MGYTRIGPVLGLASCKAPIPVKPIALGSFTFRQIQKTQTWSFIFYLVSFIWWALLVNLEIREGTDVILNLVPIFV
jgi:hypothetical protein